MGTTIGVGMSTLHDSHEAGCAALRAAIKNTGLSFGKKSNELVIVFITEDYDPEIVLEGIREGIKIKNIIGFTIAGVFTEDVIETKGIVVAIIKSDEMDFYLEIEEGLSKDQRKAGSSLGQKISSKLREEDVNALLLLLPDGVTNMVSGLVESIFDKLGTRILYAGGGAGDNLRFLKTYQFLNDRIVTDSVVSVLIMSKKSIGVSLSHGWKPISPPLVVTKSEGTIIKELDWQNAHEVYSGLIEKYENKKLDSEFAKVAMSYPFGIPQATEGMNYIIRDPIKIDSEGLITCVGEVPENAVVRIMSGDKQSLLNAVKWAVNDAMSQRHGFKASGVLVFSCVSRCLFLGDAFKDEITVIKEAVGDGVPVFGCMTFGEIGSIAGGPPEFHNKSIVICVFPL